MFAHPSAPRSRIAVPTFLLDKSKAKFSLSDLGKLIPIAEEAAKNNTPTYSNPNFKIDPSTPTPTPTPVQNGGCPPQTTRDPNRGDCVSIAELLQRKTWSISCKKKGGTFDYQTLKCTLPPDTSYEGEGEGGCAAPNVVDPYRGDCVSKAEIDKRLAAAAACSKGGGTYNPTTGACTHPKADGTIEGEDNTEDKKEGMSTGAKFAIGVAVVAAIGIGIGVMSKSSTEMAQPSMR